MTQKAAIIEALKRLGGKAKMSEICKSAREIGDFSHSQKPENTIRNCIYTNPHDFRASEQHGWWELVSYQEEIAERDKRINELEEEIARLKAVKTEDAFVTKVVEVAKKRFRHKSERNKAVAVSQLLALVGREDASENLDEWLDGKEKPFIAVNGDIVMTKNVGNEIDNVEAGASGVTINKKV